MQLGILGGDSGEQEGPPLLANAVMIVGPVGWCSLQNIANISFLASFRKNGDGKQLRSTVYMSI